MIEIRSAHRVVVLAVPPVVPFDLSIPAQILSGVEVVTGVSAYDLRTVTPDGRIAPTTAGYGIAPQGDLEELLEADTVVVAGSHAPGLREAGQLEPRTAAALRDAAQRARIVSLCTGSFVLAAAGLLEERRATTHWAYVDLFRQRFPQVNLDADALFVEDAGVLTSAGGAAAIDLCLHLVRGDHGSAVANRVARLNVVAAMRDGGQAQFVDRPVAEDADTSTARARARMLARLDQPHTLAELAAEAHMSVRTFTRRFRQETGLSPVGWLNQARLDHARHLLEATELPVDEVARQAGFGTGTNLRKRMTAALHTTPSTYRRGYRTRARATPSRRR
ncbi:GlxA family transcriptional regulator [Streptomyces sp. NPDC090442]|uniref:GlxA family transcriptional regulator n=1 Tax=Streptomyces sp. NPDC090442 TaxID=3365962 RepID=UPI0038271F57